MQVKAKTIKYIYANPLPVFMSMFKDILGADESLFRDAVALDFDYQPKLLMYRENEQRHIASCIKPLLQQRNGKNLVITGKPGVGKTVACRHVLRELEEETEDVIPIYINCWQKNTTFKIILEVCDLLNYRLTHNKKSDELFKIIKNIINKKNAVFVFDEIDKAEEFDFLYYILEEVYRKSIFLVTNNKKWASGLDERIKSRLIPEMLEFRPYNAKETEGILKHRQGYAFVSEVWEDSAFNLVVKKAEELQDIRSGLYLLREAGNAAEDNASRKITAEHVNTAVKKLDEFSIRGSDDLEEETKFILDIIKKSQESRIGDLYKKYQSLGGKSIYKTFQRKIKKLEEGGFITVKKLTGGTEGSTSIISHKSQEKKLTEF